jgi:MGT family glycosyltransferase
MPKHFAFVNMPASGHINPTLPLVEELVARGHRVSYATGPDRLEQVRAAGAEPVELPTEMPNHPPGSGFEFTPERMAQMLEHFHDDARASLPLLLEHYRADRPDAVCHGTAALTGAMLAELIEVPEVALVPHFAGNEQFSLWQDFIPEDFDFAHPELVAQREKMQAFTAEYGVTTAPQPMGGTPAPLNLVFLPEEFQLRPETFDDRFVFLGPSLGSRGRETYEPADPDKPLLFISLGTVFNDRPEFYRSCFEAFGDSDWQVAMSISHRVDPEALGTPPANFDVRPSFPQPAVLTKASVFLSHTGMNSTMESLHAGVPLVAVPQMPEQEANARRAEELGLAKRFDTLTSLPTAEQLRTAVDEVAADEQMRARAAEMSAAVRACGGARAGADVLENHLG